MALVTLQRVFESLKPRYVTRGRCVPRSWLPWIFMCCCFLFMRFLWIRIPVHDFNVKEGAAERLLADKSVQRHKQLEDQIESVLFDKLQPATRNLVSKPNFILPVLVIACNRPTVKRTLDALLKSRSTLVGFKLEQFPITVSHGCDHPPTSNVLSSYGSTIDVVTFRDNSSSIGKSNIKKGYEAVARHYKHALNRMFLHLNYSALIVVEDDLDVAVDFFHYFAATFPLLMDNQNLFCVSAWNDNGRPELVDSQRPDLLYRTDFFSGLGWMLLRSFWLEIYSGWPDIFWDEYLRKPYVRKNRACLRPELSRTITFGRIGISRGQFFDKYLKTMELNKREQNFLKMDLTYLHEPGYSQTWRHSVYNESTEVNIEQFLNGNLPTIETTSVKRIRVTYSSQADFNRIASTLNLMNDIKSGVMRNAFAGVVPVKWKGYWVYISPPPTWRTYNESWT